MFMVSRCKFSMTSMVLLGDSTLESLTPSVNAPLLSKCGFFFKGRKLKICTNLSQKKKDDFIGLQREMWQI
jgi:hypothetical protein